jgi:hypothetical protein
MARANFGSSARYSNELTPPLFAVAKISNNKSGLFSPATSVISTGGHQEKLEMPANIG